MNDFTISHHGELYQIKESVATKKITIEGHMDGKVIITNNGMSVRFQGILIRPEIGKEKECKRRREASHIPSEDYPCRKA